MGDQSGYPPDPRYFVSLMSQVAPALLPAGDVPLSIGLPVFAASVVGVEVPDGASAVGVRSAVVGPGVDCSGGVSRLRAMSNIDDGEPEEDDSPFATSTGTRAAVSGFHLIHHLISAMELLPCALARPPHTWFTHQSRTSPAFLARPPCR